MLDRAQKGRKGQPPGPHPAAGADDDPSLMYQDFFNDRMDAEDEDGIEGDTMADGALAGPDEGGVLAQAEPASQVAAAPLSDLGLACLQIVCFLLARVVRTAVKFTAQSQCPACLFLACLRAKSHENESSRPECTAVCIGTAQKSSLNWGMCGDYFLLKPHQAGESQAWFQAGVHPCQQLFEPIISITDVPGPGAQPSC